MPRVAHFCLVLKSVSAWDRRWYDLTHLEHGLGQLVKVSSPHYEHLCGLNSDLDGLEIVWEVRGSLYCAASHSLRLGVIYVEFP